MKIKISFESIKKNQRDIYFILIGLAAAIILVFVFVSSVSFLVGQLEDALGTGTSSYQPVHFNIDGLKSLNIIPTPTSTAATSSALQSSASGTVSQ